MPGVRLESNRANLIILILATNVQSPRGESSIGQSVPEHHGTGLIRASLMVAGPVSTREAYVQLNEIREINI